MLRFFDSKTGKAISLTLVAVFLSQFIMPTLAYALTSGPAQPEFSSFEPVETTQMVDPYSGDFTYNIPLLSVPGPNGGYPINMSYHSNVGMEEEASWVGLGWSLNIGAINRQLRGVPDDFSANNISYESYIKPNYSFGINIPTNEFSKERFGFPVSESSDPVQQFHPQIYYNNYRGIGYRVSYVPKQIPDNSPFGLGLNFDSQEGSFGIEPRVNFSGSFYKSLLTPSSLGFNIGASVGINSMEGLVGVNFSTGLGFNASFTTTSPTNSSLRSITGQLSSTLGFSTRASVPAPQIPITGKSGSFDIKFPIESNPNNIGAVTFLTPDYASKTYRWLYYTGYYSSSEAKNGHSAYSKPAYGYLYTPSTLATDAVIDRTNDPLPYSKKVPYLSSVSFDYDLFNMTGQGIGGMFRPYRSEVGILSPSMMENITEVNNLNYEVGVGTTPVVAYHVGFDPNSSDGQSVEYTGTWTNGNDLAQYLPYSNDHSGFREPYYFQMYGEKSAVDLAESFLNTWGGDQAVRLKLQATAPWATSQYKSGVEFIHQQGGSVIVDASNSSVIKQKTKRPRRASNLEQLTNAQAALFGYSKDVTYNDVSTPNNPIPSFPKFSNPLFNAPVNKNELSEISVLQPDGTRYIYGLPAMNVSQEEASFRIEYATSAAATGQNSTYEHNVSLLKTSACVSGSDYIGANGGGNLPLDEFFQRTKLPAYAHSWLLTTVVSSDYVDLTGDGPTPDDYGYWVKFNYKKQFSDYKWRVPYSDVSYNPGHIGDDKDNMGSYMYGTKEIYFIESVETKTHKAIFETSERKDAFEASGVLSTAENTNPRGSRAMHRLDKIKLYTKADLTANTTNAIPLQVVNFDYDYSLCPNVPNNNQAAELDANNVDRNIAHGKLTLKKLWFTYQNNNRGKLSPYIFDYSASNPAYNPQAFDKWGNFRKTGSAASEDANYPFIRFPYTLQDITPDPSTWLMTKITMPSGGKINVEYESDDYAYVQDKPALQMFDIVGTKEVVPSSDRINSAIEYTGIARKTSFGVPPAYLPIPPFLGDDNSHVYGDGDNFRVYFKMEHIPTAADLAPYSGSAKAYVLDKYIHGLTKIYFNIESHMFGSEYDEVAGYADIVINENVGAGDDFYGVVGSTQNAYITLKKVPLSKQNVFNDFLHPFQAAAFTHIRSNRPELIFPNQSTWSNSNGFATVNVLSLLSAIPGAYKAAVGINRYLSTRDYCQWIKLNGRSIIRLSAPDTKVGGGVRVKKLYIEDTNFETVGDNSTYGQEFDYTMTENGKQISSGVAYEPMIGGDESALREPVNYTNSHPLKSPLNLFTEKPILQNYYPGPSVGYRKVTVRSLVRSLANGNPTDPDLCHSVTPITSYEFYTPKDFPVITDETDISPSPDIIRGYLIPGVMTKFRKSIARSQGYSIILNDMAGKLRKMTTYIPANPSIVGSTDRIISQEEYIYKTKAPYSPTQKNELDCKVDVMGSRGVCSQALVGETSEVFVTLDENKNETETDTWNWNVGLSLTVFPYVLPIPLPTMSNSEMSLKTTVTTKVIYRTGILIEHRKFDGQATVISNNLVFDAATGAPLLARVNNEFNDHIFNYSIPAHWFYTGMSSASSNQGFMLNFSTPLTPSAGGRIDISTSVVNVKDAFEAGDELWITPSSGSSYSYKAYVLRVMTTTPDNAIRIIKENGDYITLDVKSLSITRSGRRNQLSAPAGGIELNVDPRLQNICGAFAQGGDIAGNTISLKGVLNASAVQYSNYWSKDCGVLCGTGNEIGNTINPFRSGLLGTWRAYKSYAYLDSRDQHDNIREDGIFRTFTTFNWDVPTSSVSYWTLAGTITKYSPQGYEIENKDPLGIYSSALYGYGNSLVTAVAANSRYTDMISDGFEDYPKSCTEAHWSLVSPQFNTTKGHTGKRSLLVPANTTYAVGVNVTTAAIADADQSGVPGFDATTSPTSVLLNQYGSNGVFTPVSGREYFVSTWVNEVTTGLTYFPSAYSSSQIQLDFYTDNTMTTSTGAPVVLSPSSSEQIIEGWQRISGKVVIPVNTGYVRVSFKSTSASSTVSFDDFRMLPSKGSMRAFVYDPLNLRHVADLDDNNFATFYVYDDEGRLVMKRVETSEGIRTIQESRTGTVH